MQQPDTPPEASAVPPDSAVPVPSPERAADRVPEAPPADPAPDVDALLRKAEEEVAGLKDAWLRARAELENVRKVAAADVAKAHRYAAEKFAADLLPVKDALEQTLAAANASPEQLRAGVELTLKELRSAFERAQVAEVDRGRSPHWGAAYSSGVRFHRPPMIRTCDGALANRPPECDGPFDTLGAPGRVVRLARCGPPGSAGFPSRFPRIF